MAKADYSVFIGRFQPIHNGHLKIIENAIKDTGRLIIVVGSHRAPVSLKNPWSFEERKNLIEKSLNPAWLEKISIVPCRDFVYNGLNWTVGIQSVVQRVIQADEDKMGMGQSYGPSSYRIKLVGHYKDDSSYYLNEFPQWELIREPNYFNANSRDIRAALFGESRVMDWLVPDAVSKFLHDYMSQDLGLFNDLKDEYHFLKDYKDNKRWAEHKPTFTTTDAVVVMSGHVLLVRRGKKPGKGCFALPGGFVNTDETLLDSALRELKEETRIIYPKDQLKASLKKQHVFDHPYRDNRGRTITHGFYFNLPAGELPKVKGGDDAAEAFWMPLADVAQFEDRFYSDHMHIINYFVYDGQ
jgi:bifunctional NMN adenylyltransferase/nudix hydrolase